MNNAREGGQSAQRPDGSSGRILIAYFSRTGKNYGDVNLEVGNTARIAQFIGDRTGGDLFEIAAAEPYPDSYDETTDRAQREQDDHIFPEIAGTVPDTAAYDTVFLGFPIWWAEQPMVVQTFMRDHDLNHATVIPFVTHEGSSFGNSLAVIKRYYPQARLVDGFAARGTAVHDHPDATRRDVEHWLQQLGF